MFPKIDGTNGTVWLSDGEVQAGSRSRQLSAESDNAGFYKNVKSDRRFRAFLHAKYTRAGVLNLRNPRGMYWNRTSDLMPVKHAL